VELINQKLGVDNREKIATGQVIKALILNGLGMVSRPLYLFSQFFEDKAIEKLLGTGINSEYLNDDKIGRVMDDIYQLGLTNLFIELGLLVIKKFKIETKYAHLDSTGRFILATNIESSSDFHCSEILWNYKNQQSCERGLVISHTNSL
jgi:transposase